MSCGPCEGELKKTRCSCDGCSGHLLSDGRDVDDGLTFLECSECCCLYAAPDLRRAKGKETR